MGVKAQPGKYCNYDCIRVVWRTIDRHKLPASLRPSTLPTSIPTVRTIRKAFHMEWSPNCGVSLVEFAQGNLFMYDGFFAGPRGNEDIDRIKKGEKYEIHPEEGYGRSAYKRGRAKTTIFRPWNHHTICLCKGGKHRGPPPGYVYHVDRKTGNPHPSYLPSWSTNCPLANWQFKEQFREARGRRYAKLNKHGSGFTSYNEGDVVKAAIDFMIKMGLNTEELRFSHNSGRKVFARLCSKFDVGYELSFEVHGDRYVVWQGNYQPDCKPSNMERRDQHRNPDVCCQALRMIANGLGLGIIKAERLSRQELYMDRILRKLGDGAFAEQIRVGTAPQPGDTFVDDSDEEEDFAGPPPRGRVAPRRIPEPPAKRRKPSPRVDEWEEDWDDDFDEL